MNYEDEFYMNLFDDLLAEDDILAEKIQEKINQFTPENPLYLHLKQLYSVKNAIQSFAEMVENESFMEFCHKELSEALTS